MICVCFLLFVKSVFSCLLLSLWLSVVVVVSSRVCLVVCVSCLCFLFVVVMMFVCCFLFYVCVFPVCVFVVRYC